MKKITQLKKDIEKILNDNKAINVKAINLKNTNYPIMTMDNI